MKPVTIRWLLAVIIFAVGVFLSWTIAGIGMDSPTILVSLLLAIIAALTLIGFLAMGIFVVSNTK
jgi:hypothetical protein